jgi:hypothetical protein
MSKLFSIKRFAVLTAGLAIGLSSCGIQNQAGDSGGSRTKNFALVNGKACFESEAQLSQEVRIAIDQWNRNYVNWFSRYGTLDSPSAVLPNNAENLGGFVVGVDYRGHPDGVSFANAYWAPYRSPMIGGCEEQIAAFNDSVADGTPTVARGAVNVRECYKPEVKQQIIDGYNEQLARPLGGEVTQAYLDEMQKGLDAISKTCTN